MGIDCDIVLRRRLYAQVPYLSCLDHLCGVDALFRPRWSAVAERSQYEQHRNEGAAHPRPFPRSNEESSPDLEHAHGFPQGADSDYTSMTLMTDHHLKDR